MVFSMQQVRQKIRLLPRVGTLEYDDLVRFFPDARTIYLCDFPLTGAERGERITGGFQVGKVKNIDHHFEVPEFYRFISSGNLGCAQVREHGPAGDDDIVVITHTDCDSVVTASIVAGLFTPEQRFEDAVIAADHTGEPNPIADLLQGLDELKDMMLSFSTLAAFLERRKLPSQAESARQKHLAERERARTVLDQFSYHGTLATLSIPGKIDGGFFPSLLPDAALILLFVDHPSIAGKRQAKLRLGKAARPGATIYDLKVREFDANYGGRWNAGSNERNGGLDFSEAEYLRLLTDAIARAWN